MEIAAAVDGWGWGSSQRPSCPHPITATTTPWRGAGVEPARRGVLNTIDQGVVCIKVVRTS